MVLHDQGEGYQQTKLLEVGVAQVVKEVFHFQIPYLDQNSIKLLVIGPIPFLALDLIDPRSSLYKGFIFSYLIFLILCLKQTFEREKRLATDLVEKEVGSKKSHY